MFLPNLANIVVDGTTTPTQRFKLGDKGKVSSLIWAGAPLSVPVSFSHMYNALSVSCRRAQSRIAYISKMFASYVPTFLAVATPSVRLVVLGPHLTASPAFLFAVWVRPKKYPPPLPDISRKPLLFQRGAVARVGDF